MRLKGMMIVMAVFLFVASFGYPQGPWVGKDGNMRNVDAKSIIIDQGELYLATRNELYHARTARDKWESIFSLPAGDNEIRCLAVRLKNIFVGTRRGLFRSQDQGRTWKNIFRTIIPEKNNVLAVEVSRHNQKKVTIGTEKGIFISEDSGDSWKDISGILKNRNVRCIALNKEYIYAGGDDGLYVKKDGPSGWDRIYVRSPLEKSGEEVPVETEDSEGDSAGSINCIAVKDSRVYIGLDKRILYSDDIGKSWNTFASAGLAGVINYILIPPKEDKLYCATTKGVFEFVKDKSRWLELYKGTDRMFGVTKMGLDGESENHLWAVTEKGVYRLESGKYLGDQYIDVEKNLKVFKVIFDNEPVFKDLQRAAMKFAEVDPDKIKRWRNEARLRALVPKVTVGMDKNRSTTAEIYTSATKDYVVAGPDDTSDGFDVSISWELADLIWSDDQTNIDVRSRLTTQLRNDILDDLRRAYYERKRLQFELLYEVPQDPKARFEKEMRIQELTQSIDDLTGNYLSDNIRKADSKI